MGPKDAIPMAFTGSRDAKNSTKRAMVSRGVVVGISVISASSGPVPVAHLNFDPPASIPPRRGTVPVYGWRCQCILSPRMERPPDPQLVGFLTAYDRNISDLALALREVILEEAPDASESIYQVYTVAVWFGFSGKMKDMFCYITTHGKHVNLGFPRGATLPDLNRVLEGEG